MLLRGLAAAGQSTAVLAASFGLGVELRLDLCAPVIGAAAFNVRRQGGSPASRRLSEAEAAVTLGCDLGQHGALVCLSGGLADPFAADARPGHDQRLGPAAARRGVPWPRLLGSHA